MRTIFKYLLGVGCVFSIWSGASAQDSKMTIGPHDADLTDIRLRYVVAGHGPLVFVTSPGWGPGSLYLQKGLSTLEEQFTLLFLDTRGSGESSRPADSTKMAPTTHDFAPRAIISWRFPFRLLKHELPSKSNQGF